LGGSPSTETVLRSARPPLARPLRVAPELLYRLPALLRERQSVFARTGGLHAAGLFTAQGELLEVREDIGRHNATDKIVGAAFLARRLPLADRILLVSGRAGFEIVQKAFAAGIPFIASVSAPSSLAAALAESAGVTLVGFLRGLRFNGYSSRERVLRDTPPELQDRFNGAGQRAAEVLKYLHKSEGAVIPGEGRSKMELPRRGFLKATTIGGSIAL